MKKPVVIISLALFCTLYSFSQGILVNHTSTGITQIPESAIVAAKSSLHIAYGHTSHGSQLTDGMTGLVAFMNGRGFTNNLYAWNNGGTGGALDLHDYAMGGDVGYYPDWVNNRRAYLGTPNPSTGRGTGANADVNVIIWSWCGQVSGKYTAGTLNSEYINPMVQLETDYPGIKFVYMTGHLDHADDAANKNANQAIRNFCQANNKILYDFADIESYDPDNNFYQYAGDDCSYYASATGALLGNWATAWQNSHTVNVDWYNCSSAHSQPLNANRKAYAAWWLWSRLAGWNPTTGITNGEEDLQTVSVYPNPSTGILNITSTTGSINRVEVFNMLGAKVYTINDFGKQSTDQIDLSGIHKGIYLLKIHCPGRTHTKKIVIR